jgi:hypothetical protein
LDEVQQQEPATTRIDPVAVAIAGPVRTQEVPSVDGGIRRLELPVTTGAPIQILNQDPRRRRVTILSTDVAFKIGPGRDYVEALWPINVPLPWRCEGELWGISNTAAVATLTIVEERWTE